MSGITGLETSLMIANSGIANIGANFAVMSQNVANAGTTGYAAETQTQQSLTAGGIGMGVASGAVTRYVNQQLQANLWTQNGDVSALQTMQTVLQPVNAALGTPGQGGGSLKPARRFAKRLFHPARHAGQRDPPAERGERRAKLCLRHQCTQQCLHQRCFESHHETPCPSPAFTGSC